MKRFFFKRRRAVAISTLLIVLLVSFIIPQLRVYAATITVNDASYPGTPDDNLCSLDEAVAAANANADDPLDCVGADGIDTIVFANSIVPVTINITNSLQSTDPQDKINGNLNRVRFNVVSPNVTISGLTLEDFAGPAITVDSVANVTIANNIIYDVSGAGITVLAGATNVSITGNVIGYSTSSLTIPTTALCSDSPTGTTSVSGTGILVGDADGTIISGNTVVCSSIGISVSNADNVQITNNNIGTSSTGLTTSIGNSGDGIVAINATDIIITNNLLRNNENGINLNGVTCAGGCQVDGNTVGSIAGISGNRANGIVITNSDGIDLVDNTIRDNGDGIDPGGVGENGVLITNSTDVTFQGGIITGNSQDGIAVTGTSSGIFIDSASDPVLIFDNGGLGIDLDNNGVSNTPVTNGGQSFPTMTDPVYTDGTTVAGQITYDEAGSAHFYSNTACDPTDFGEGETYLDTVTIAAAGPTTFAISPAPAAGSFITVITVDGVGNTSEFSECVLVEALIAAFTPIPATQVVGLPVAFDNLSTTNPDPTVITYTWDFGDGSPAITGFDPGPYSYTAPGTYTVTLCLTVAGIPANVFEVCTTEIVTIIDIPTNTPTNTPVPPTNVPTVVIPTTAVPTATIVPTTAVPTVTLVPTTVVPTVTLVPTTAVPTTAIPTTLVPTLIPTLVPTTIVPTTAVPTFIPTPEPETATAIAIARSLTPAPTLVYFARTSPPLRQCVAQNGVLLCVEIDLNNPVTDTVSFTTADGQVISGAAFEPYVIKFARPTQLLPGSPITYTIQVVNPTGSTIRNIRVTDNMPIGVTIVGSSASSGTISVDGRQVNFNQASLAANSIITITINGYIRDDRVFQANELDNQACVTSSGNAGSQCATFGFSPTTGIGTGETPLLLNILRSLFVTLSLAVIGVLSWFGIRQLHRKP